MIFVFYACLAGGVVLLVEDLRGRFTPSPERVRWWGRIGIAAAAGPGLAPLLAWLTGRLEVTWPYPLIAFGYLVFFLVFVAGFWAWPVTVPLRRCAAPATSACWHWLRSRASSSLYSRLSSPSRESRSLDRQPHMLWSVEATG
jgi:MFS family permease